MPRRSVSFVLLAVLSFLTPASTSLIAQAHPPSQTQGTLRGRVVDPADAPLPAFVLIHSERDNTNNQHVSLQPDGTYELNLAPGFYDVFVAHYDFLPIAKLIEIKSGKTTHLKLTMKIDEKHNPPTLVK